jgi:hypothetical protein
MQVKDLLDNNSIYEIHAGNSSIWSSPCIPGWKQIHDHLITPVVTTPLPNKVADLWEPGTHNWNHHLLTSTFTDQAVHTIEATPFVNSDTDDILRWEPAKNGLCTTKSVYQFLTNQQVHQLPSIGARSISAEANSILQKVWKSKSIPPLLQTFAWRLIRRALATAERAGRYSIHITQNCSYCGAIETDQHLFFKSQLPTEVWSTANPQLLTNNVPDELDGIQMTSPALITSNPEDHILFRTLFILWYIWKARNDSRFQRKTWTAAQVHLAANAHMNTHLQAIGLQEPTHQVSQAILQPTMVGQSLSPMADQGMNLSSAGPNQEPTEQTSQSHQQLQANEQQTDTHQGQRHHSISSGQTNRPMPIKV